jgi:hypothetical protein
MMAENLLMYKKTILEKSVEAVEDGFYGARGIMFFAEGHPYIVDKDGEVYTEDEIKRIGNISELKDR